VRSGACLDDPIHSLLTRLLAAKDPVEIDSLSVELRAALHERINSLREEARSISRRSSRTDRKKTTRQNPEAKKH